MSIHSLEIQLVFIFNLKLSDDIKTLQHKYQKLNLKHTLIPSLLNISDLSSYSTEIFLPSTFIFDNLSDSAKKLCESEVPLCEESVDEHAASIQFSGSEEEKNRRNNDFLLGKLRLLTLRRAYMKHLLPDQVPFKVMIYHNI
jgi:hypothetical protein